MDESHRWRESAGAEELPGPQSARDGGFQVVAMVSSAGGISALSKVLAGLDANFSASVLVVQHLDPRHESLMADILNRRTPLQVIQARDGEALEPGVVYVAPPDRHLLVNPDRHMHLSQSELVHFLRPSGDLLFESVAAVYRERAIGVVLTGTGSDGALGVQGIKKVGGTVIAQDQASSEFFGMPGAAIKTGVPDFVLPLEEIARALNMLVMGEALGWGDG
jgi:two-component system chemotaxis response regulator CheB